MKKARRTKCLMPKCDKEVFDSKTKFCGEHKRKVNDSKKWLAGGAVSVIGLMVASVVKKD